jgi:hypothetical protein
VYPGTHFFEAPNFLVASSQSTVHLAFTSPLDLLHQIEFMFLFKFLQDIFVVLRSLFTGLRSADFFRGCKLLLTFCQSASSADFNPHLSISIISNRFQSVFIHPIFLGCILSPPQHDGSFADPPDDSFQV